MFIWRGKPVLSFSKKLSRYENSEILWCLNVIASSNSYMVTPSLTWIGIFFFFKIAFTLNYWLLCVLGCLTCNIESVWKKITTFFYKTSFNHSTMIFFLIFFNLKKIIVWLKRASFKKCYFFYLSYVIFKKVLSCQEKYWKSNNICNTWKIKKEKALKVRNK